MISCLQHGSVPLWNKKQRTVHAHRAWPQKIIGCKSFGNRSATPIENEWLASMKWLAKSNGKEKQKQIQTKSKSKANKKEKNIRKSKGKRDAKANERVSEYQANDSSAQKVSSYKPDVSGAHGHIIWQLLQRNFFFICHICPRFVSPEKQKVTTKGNADTSALK